MRLFCIIALSFLLSPCFAWDINGHRIVATIATDHLNACTAKKIQNLLKQGQAMLPRAQINSLVTAANWLDHDHSQCEQYAASYCFPPPKSWHYINTPYIISGFPKTWPTRSPNVVWALDNAIRVLSNPNSSAQQKVQSLLIIDHLAGDITQPLHNIEAYDSSHFWHGDKGGNSYLISYAPHCQTTYPVDNLHAFWDQGAGLFSCHNGQKIFIKEMARSLEMAYEKDTNFKTAVDNAVEAHANASTWSKQAYGYANLVYQIPYRSIPGQDYTQHAQAIVKQQIMIGGIRLAAIFNQAFISNGSCH